MECRDVRPWLATRRDLSWAQEREVQAHLQHCPACSTAWTRAERAIHALRALPATSAQPPQRVAAALQVRLGQGARTRQPFARGLALAGLALCLVLAGVLIPRDLVRRPFAGLNTGAPRATQVAAQADATATPMEPQGQADLITQVDTFLGPMVSAGTFSGAVLLARDGTILLSRAYGMANREHDVPTTPQTKFRISAITMQFTAMAMLLLQEQGKLKVADRICQYVADCPASWQAITIHHLLTHTSGIPDFTGQPEYPEYQAIKGLPSTPSQSMARFRDRPLDFEPGSRGAFSVSNYVVLGAIIEEVSSQLYPNFMREQIFAPLEMHDTGFDTRAVLKHRAAGYKGRGTLNADFVDLSGLQAALGMYSTVEDLYRWDQALYTEQLVPQTAIDTMLTPHAEISYHEVMQYGYGWEIYEQDGRRMVAHLGAAEGFSGLISRYPDDKTVVIVLSNLEWPDIEVYGVSERLARMIVDQR